MLSTDHDTLTYATMPKLAYPRDRKAESRNGLVLPPGTVVVSPDNHLSVNEDIWYKNFPQRLMDQAPRVREHNGGFVIFGADGKSLFPPSVEFGFAAYDQLPGTCQIGPRMLDLDAEGVDKEIVFPNAVLGLLSHSNFEVREWIFKIYNDYLLRLNEQAPERFFGVALANYWDLKGARSHFAGLKAQGFKTFMLPLKPAKGMDGSETYYASPEMEPLWEAIEESGLPISFHIGENHWSGRGGFGTSMLMNFNPFRNVVGHMIMGGIFDRHPNLKVVFVEAGINWIPGVIQDMEMMQTSHHEFLDWKLAHPPKYYWENNCYATFMVDPIGLRLLDLIGPERVMWASDYPHTESTFGYGWTAMKQVVDAAKSSDDARRMLGGTAIDVYSLA